MEKKQPLKKVVLGKLDNYVKRMKLEHYLIPFPKINSKWIKDLNVRPDTIKFFKENTGTTLSDIICSSISLDSSLTVMKIKVNKRHLVKLGSFCTAKETMNKMKRQPSEQEKIFANAAQYKKQTNKQKKQPNQKMGTRPKQTFLQRRPVDDQDTHEKLLDITNC